MSSTNHSCGQRETPGLPPLSRLALVALIRSEAARRLARATRWAALHPDAPSDVAAARQALALAHARRALHLVWPGDSAETQDRHAEPASWRDLEAGEREVEP